jgi:hypothetical protein
MRCSIGYYEWAHQVDIGISWLNDIRPEIDTEPVSRMRKTFNQLRKGTKLREI